MSPKIEGRARSWCNNRTTLDYASILAQSERDLSLVFISLLHVRYSLRDGQETKILKWDKVEWREMQVGLLGKGTIGNGVENLSREHSHEEKNRVRLQTKAR